MLCVGKSILLAEVAEACDVVRYQLFFFPSLTRVDVVVWLGRMLSCSLPETKGEG